MYSCTSAITKRHAKSRRSPKFSVPEVHPYIGMVFPLADTCVVLRSLRPCRSLRGKTHRSDPVCTRYCCFNLHSVMKRRAEMMVQTLAAVNTRFCSFPAGGSTVLCIFGRRPQYVIGTSRYRWVSDSYRGSSGP